MDICLGVQTTKDYPVARIKWLPIDLCNICSALSNKYIIPSPPCDSLFPTTLVTQESWLLPARWVVQAQNLVVTCTTVVMSDWGAQRWQHLTLIGEQRQRKQQNVENKPSVPRVPPSSLLPRSNFSQHLNRPNRGEPTHQIPRQDSSLPRLHSKITRHMLSPESLNALW